MSDIPFRQRLEQHNNPEEVRQRLAAGNYNQAHARIAQEYLDSLERKDASGTSARRESREEATLLIAREASDIARSALAEAKEANSIARSQATAAWRAARYAMYAAVIATTALLISKAEAIIAWLQ